MIRSEEEEAATAENSFENVAGAGKMTGSRKMTEMFQDMASPVEAPSLSSCRKTHHLLLILEWTVLGNSETDGFLLGDFLMESLLVTLSIDPTFVFRYFPKRQTLIPIGNIYGTPTKPCALSLTWIESSRYLSRKY